MRSSHFLPGALLALAGVSAPLRAGPLGGETQGQYCLVAMVDGEFRFGGIGSPIDVVGAAEGAVLATINSLTFDGNVDPTLGYALGIIDVGAATTFSFTFTTPALSVLYSAASYTYPATLTDGTNDGSSVAPISPNTNVPGASADLTEGPNTSAAESASSLLFGIGLIATATVMRKFA